jgi:hypothetical protein
MSKETSNAREGDSTEGCRQGVGRDPAHPDAGVGGNPSGLSTPIAAGGGETWEEQSQRVTDEMKHQRALAEQNTPSPSSSDLVERCLKRGNDAETLSESYEGQRQEKWFKDFAATFREAADTIRAARAALAGKGSE